MNLAWRAWTKVGVVDSGSHRWEDLPDDGVYFVMTYYRNERGAIMRRQVSGDDWFFLWRQPGKADLIGSNRDSPEENQRRYPGCILKRGKWVDDLTFQAIVREACDRGSDILPAD